jgi:hypothetical protein
MGHEPVGGGAVPVLLARAMMTSTTYLERCLSGEYEHGWAELAALGAAVREEPRVGGAAG